MKGTYLILDLETVADTSRWQRSQEVTEFPPTWAQRVIVAGWVQLSPAFEYIACGTHTGPWLDTLEDPDVVERELLLALSRHIQTTSERVLVTYNGRTFDLPVMMQRCLLHTVPMPWHFKPNARHRYKDNHHIDLCDQLTDHGACKNAKLDVFAKLIGMPGKGKVTGADVEPLYNAGELETIRRYCLDDVAQTAMLLLRFHLLRGGMSISDCKETELRLATSLSRAGAFVFEESADDLDFGGRDVA